MRRLVTMRPRRLSLFKIGDKPTFEEGKSVLQYDPAFELEEAEYFELQQRLLAYRERRVRPERDDKVLTGWNTWMISGLLRAATALEGSLGCKLRQGGSRLSPELSPHRGQPLSQLTKWRALRYPWATRRLGRTRCCASKSPCPLWRENLFRQSGLCCGKDS